MISNDSINKKAVKISVIKAAWGGGGGKAARAGFIYSFGERTLSAGKWEGSHGYQVGSGLVWGKGNKSWNQNVTRRRYGGFLENSRHKRTTLSKEKTEKKIQDPPQFPEKKPSDHDSSIGIARG